MRRALLAALIAGLLAGLPYAEAAPIRHSTAQSGPQLRGNAAGASLLARVERALDGVHAVVGVLRFETAGATGPALSGTVIVSHGTTVAVELVGPLLSSATTSIIDRNGSTPLVKTAPASCWKPLATSSLPLPFLSGVGHAAFPNPPVGIWVSGIPINVAAPKRTSTGWTLTLDQRLQAPEFAHPGTVTTTYWITKALLLGGATFTATANGEQFSERFTYPSHTPALSATPRCTD